MKILLLIFVVLAIVPPVSADIYKYVDENGVLIFTDNFVDVPADQRQTVDRFKEIKSAPPAKAVESTMQPPAPPPKKKNSASSLAPNAENLTKLQTLNAEKQRLDKEYETLVRQRQALGKNKPDLTDASALEAYRKKVNALNRKIKAFDTKRSAFEKKVAAFNLKNTPPAE